MTDLTRAQLEVLKFADEYGPAIDFGGRGANRAQFIAAKELLGQGLLAGQPRHASITENGRAALARVGQVKND
jgi:hypothetical protein